MVLQSVPLRVRLLSSGSLIFLGASVSAALSVPAAAQTVYQPVYQQPAYGYPTPAYGYPSAGWQQQQQQLSPQAQVLYSAPQQVPGQSQAQFGPGVGQTAPLAAVVDPPGGVGGYNAPGAMAQGIRGQLLARSARGIGLRAGFSEEVGRLNIAVDQVAPSLEGRFDFRQLLVDSMVIPPVITEVREVGELENDKLVRLSLGTYRIVAPGRLALKVPTWRDYLNISTVPTMPFRGPDFVPRTEEERATYEQLAEQARLDGIEEARALFAVNLSRLIRDYDGMKLYHSLAGSGAVSLPKVSRTGNDLSVTEHGTRAAVGNVTLELIVSPTFKLASKSSYLGDRAVPPRPTPRSQSESPPPPPRPAGIAPSSMAPASAQATKAAQIAATPPEQ
ncbi:type IV secretory system conjugative DNA transfer family protein [Xanthobacter sp. DSM 14520]|uniref:type IV secretory system conjugative DNA transfer family protein n=1 Tax=Xanthobacter autotrophicus (strain ATCC BAA-1158 / Py2) TaxID=78245 RepID=UPI003728D82B